MKKILLLSFSTVILAASCSKSEDDKDTPKPTITILNTDLQTDDICGHIEDNVIGVLTNDTLTVMLKFEGTNTLSQYKISAHQNGDCHEHESTGIGLSEDWEVNKVVDLSTNLLEVTEKFHIPQDAHIGNYHFTVQLVDVKGVEADSKELNIVIAHP